MILRADCDCGTCCPDCGHTAGCASLIPSPWDPDPVTPVARVVEPTPGRRRRYDHDAYTL